MKLINVFYWLCYLTGVYLLINLYIINSNGETYLMSVVWYWFSLLNFGYFGLLAERMKRKNPGIVNRAIALNKTDDKLIEIFAQLKLILTSGVALLLYNIPFYMFSVSVKYYSIKIAVTGTAILCVLLWVFLTVVFPSL